MLEKKRPKAILLEDNDIIRQSAGLILSKQGWDVTFRETAKQALETLESDKNGPFALFVSNYRLPKMQGDDILERVKKISPLTQRMLMIAEEEPEILISAINRAVVDACITAPYKEEDLILQSRVCFRQFKQEVKRKRLKRVTRHQNQQMLKVAQKLKKKDNVNKHEIREKKRLLLQLKSKKREVSGSRVPGEDISVPLFLKFKSVELNAQTLFNEFCALSRSVQSVFETACRQLDFETFDGEIAPLFEPAPKEIDPTDICDEEDGKKEKSQKVSETAGEPLKKKIDDADDDLEGSVESINRMAGQVITYVLQNDLREKDKTEPGQDPCEASKDGEPFPENPLDDLFELSLSEHQTRAVIKRKSGYNPEQAPDLSKVLEWLAYRMISYGIIDDDEIETWLKKSKVDEMVIAQGDSPVFGRPGIIAYHFETDFTNPGKINEDGSIDFRDRGHIPFVEKDTLLAQKTLAVQGKSGMTVSGISIPVDEVMDPVMTPGSGVRISEDGLSVFADIDGQPHVDALGTVCVSPELVIPGDVDFETGNIDFKGNILVRGMIKEGFSVKGINLTAQEIEGADIKLSGDLNVSAGITEATIEVQGNIHAKFINNSKIMGFGDLFISKEIIDSQILISGSCQNTTGHIITSTITAKLGVEAGNIGTAASKPSIIKVGVDEHVESIKNKIDEKLELSVNKTNLYRDDIKNLEAEDQSLYERISQNAFVQDRSQVEIKKITESLPDLEKAKDLIKLSQAKERIKQLEKKAVQSENELNHIFGTQDKIAERINLIKEKIEMLEEKNKKLVLERRAIKNFSQKNDPIAKVCVSKTIAQDTVVKGPHASTIIQEDRSKCVIQQTAPLQDGIQYFEMTISDLTQ